MKRKLFAALLALCLALSLLPVTALAEDKQLSGSEFLGMAVDGVISLDGNVTLTSTATINSDLTIQLNGHTITRDTTNPSQSLGVLMLDINGDLVTIEGPGTITGGDYGTLYYYSPKGVIDVAGSASLTVKGRAEIKGGSIESNETIGDFDTIKFASSGTLTIEDSTVVGLDYGDREAGNAVYVSGTAAVVVSGSTLTGGSSTSYEGGNALELRTSGVPAQITNSTLTGGNNQTGRDGGIALYVSSTASATVTGGSLTGGQGNSGGDGVNVSGSVTLNGVTVTGGASTNSIPGAGVYCEAHATNVTIIGCTVTGGSPAEGTTTNSAGRGVEIYGPVVLTVDRSTIKGGNNNRTIGDPIGGNAIWFCNADTAEAKITLTDTTLAIGNEAAGNAVITGNSYAPASSGGMLANITAGGTLTVDGGTLKNTTITPAETGVTIVANEEATAVVGQNNLTVASKSTVENAGQTTYYPTATKALENAAPNSTVIIQELEENETLSTVPTGVILKNETGGEITVGSQTVADGEELADWVAQIGEQRYISLADAFSAAGTMSGSVTITLLDDVDSATAITIPAGVTLNGNGNAINCTAEIANGAFLNAGGDGVKIWNLTVNTNGNVKHGIQFYCVNGGELSGVTVNGGSYTSVIVNGATNIVLEDCQLNPSAANGKTPYATIEYAMGQNVDTIPSMSVENITFGNTSVPKVWVDDETVGRMKETMGGTPSDQQVLDKINEQITNMDGSSLSVTVELTPGSTTDTEIEGTNPPQPIDPSEPAVPSETVGDYIVSVDRAAGGTVTVNPGRADKGDTVTVTVKPNDGYVLDELTVTAKEGGSVKLTWKADNKYTFTMPSGAVTVAAVFVKEGSQQPVVTLPFTDVAESDWYYDAVQYVYENELMNGTSASTFSPFVTTSRAMILTILARYDGVDTSAGSTWYEAGAVWAIAEGVSDGTNLEADLTREQLVTMLWRYAGSPAAAGDLSGYPDGASVSDWAAEAMLWAVDSGIITGNEAGALNPQGTATRAEVATILMRYLEN